MRARTVWAWFWIILGILYFNEPTTTTRLFFLVLLIGSILGLKLASSN